MTGRIVRLLAALLSAILGVLLNLGASHAMATVLASTTAPHVYDGHRHDAVTADVTAVSGPRAASDRFTVHDAVNALASGALAHPNGPTPPEEIRYTYTASLLQVATDTTTAGGQLLLPDVEFASFQRFVVAANTAEAAADAALAAGRTTGAAAELRVGGQVFTDVSTGGAPRVLNGSVQEALDAVPLAQQAPWHGYCAEMGCLSQALNAGVNPAGGSIRAVAIGTSNPGHGLPKVICTSCSTVLDVFGVGR